MTDTFVRPFGNRLFADDKVMDIGDRAAMYDDRETGWVWFNTYKIAPKHSALSKVMKNQQERGGFVMSSIINIATNCMTWGNCKK